MITAESKTCFTCRFWTRILWNDGMCKLEPARPQMRTKDSSCSDGWRAIKDCDQCDYEHAIHAGRARWLCPKCRRDFSIEYLLWFEAAHPEMVEDKSW